MLHIRLLYRELAANLFTIKHKAKHVSKCSSVKIEQLFIPWQELE